MPEGKSFGSCFFHGNSRWGGEGHSPDRLLILMLSLCILSLFSLLLLECGETHARFTAMYDETGLYINMHKPIHFYCEIFVIH